jgi:hypothetical protein
MWKELLLTIILSALLSSGTIDELVWKEHRIIMI